MVLQSLGLGVISRGQTLFHTKGKVWGDMTTEQLVTQEFK